MYGRCGRLDDARRAFAAIPIPNRFSWNILFQACVANGQIHEASGIFENMPERDLVSWNAMLAAYSQAGHLHPAQRLFQEMPEHNVVSWTTLMAAFANGGDLARARSTFEEMPARNVVTWTTIIVAYADCSELAEAQRLFDAIPERNLVTWTAMVAAYAQNGQLPQAMSMFHSMPERNALSWTALLLGFLEAGEIDRARALHDQMPELNVISSTAMLAAYAESGQFEQAKNLFDAMPDRNIVSWTAMLVAYSKSQQSLEAIQLFSAMDLEGIQPDAVSFITVVDACADGSDLARGKLLHQEIIHLGYQSDQVLSNALLNLYGRCGRLTEAKSLFDRLPDPSTESWNAMIAIYTRGGQNNLALDLFPAMNLRGFELDEISFVSVLSACGHGGFMPDAITKFASISMDFGLERSANHYRCLIDALGRAGRLRDARDVIAAMPYQADCMAWTSVLGACHTSSDLEQGSSAAERALQLEPSCPSSYVLLSNIHFQG
ncbi:pentatricopeptide repeat-containing protein At4g02750 [Selaginella moellendorffii]|nr:pentatricopeptide repeat-containing protein At4g02750 [Selaginella moellendorffii]|eukprot:XP_002984058.2 pentatricopeptide repeat-containing protein At4g02750 [Selaginella moellendorffii]